MFFVPSTQLTIYREQEGEDQYGDPTTDRSLVKQGVDAHIYQRDVDAAEPTSGRLMTTRVLKAIIAGDVDVNNSDILEDSTGKTFTVSEVSHFYNPFDKAHCEVTLRRIS